MLGTTVEVFGRHEFEPIERVALLNGLLGYLMAPLERLALAERAARPAH